MAGSTGLRQKAWIRWTRRDQLHVGVGSPVAAAGWALSACGSTADGPASQRATDPITISVGTDWSAGPRGEIMTQALSLFAQKHPSITVDRHDLAGGVYADKIAAMFAAGNQDDVLLVNAPQLPYYRDLGSFVDLTQLVRAAKIDTKVYTYLDAAHVKDGKRYFLPFQLGGGVWTVNKTLFRDEGVALPNENWTWNEWADAARKLTRPEKNQYGLGPAPTTNLQVSILPLILSNGGHHISQDFKQTTLAQAQALETIRWVADRITRDRSWVAPGVEGVSFKNGNLAMSWGNTSNIGNAETGMVKDLAGKFDWDLMPQPKAPRTGKSLTARNQQPFGITVKPVGGSARIEAAFNLLVHMAGRDVQQLIAKDRGSTPALRELVGASPYTDAPPASMGLIARGLGSEGDIRFFNGYEEWREAYNAALTDVWTSKVSADAGAQLATAAGDAMIARLGRK